MTSDITVCQEDAVYRVELNRPDCGNLVTTEMVLALSDAMVYSTVEIDARRALAMGLVSEVVPDSELGARAGKLIETLSSQPLDAVKAVKEHLKSAPHRYGAGSQTLALAVEKSIKKWIGTA